MYNLKIMNRKIYITLVFALAFLTKSCDKFIEEDLITDVSAASYYTTESGLEDGVRASYSYLKPFFAQYRIWVGCFLSQIQVLQLPL